MSDAAAHKIRELCGPDTKITTLSCGYDLNTQSNQIENLISALNGSDHSQCRGFEEYCAGCPQSQRSGRHCDRDGRLRGGWSRRHGNVE